MEINIENNNLDFEVGITKVYPEQEDLTVSPTSEKQVFNHPNSYGYDNVVVKAVETEVLNVVPKEETQNFTGLYGEVNIDKINVEEKVAELDFSDRDTVEVVPSDNKYLNKVIINKDDNLAPSNIKDGVEVFGVTGTGQILDLEINDCHYMFAYGARSEVMDKILKVCKNVTRTNNMFYYGTWNDMIDLSLYKDELFKFNTTTRQMFCYCTALKKIKIGNVDAPNLTNTGSMFSSCQKLTNIDMSLNAPNLEDAQNMFNGCYVLESITGVEKFFTSKMKYVGQMFYDCQALKSIDLSNCDGSNIDGYVNRFFQNCRALKRVDISTFTSTKITNTSTMFASCSSLKAVIINQNRVFPMTNINMFSNSTIASGTGYVYVPDNMVEEYKSATNWSTYASQIKGLSELPPEEA